MELMDRNDSKSRLLDATFKVVRSKGYAATRIEDVCAEAGLTKGSFFHHFKSKDDLALTAAALWDQQTRALFAGADYHHPASPRDRILAYVDFRKAMLVGDLADYTCFAGTIVQEAYATHTDVSDICAGNILDHAATLEADIAEAMQGRQVEGGWTAPSLARHILAVIQGAFIIAKAAGAASAAAECLDHLRRYLELLLPQTRQTED
jgi:TetR/AcrR family transcriptional repressor of nem operon